MTYIHGWCTLRLFALSVLFTLWGDILLFNWYLVYVFQGIYFLISLNSRDSTYSLSQLFCYRLWDGNNLEAVKLIVPSIWPTMYLGTCYFLANIQLVCSEPVIQFVCFGKDLITHKILLISSISHPSLYRSLNSMDWRGNLVTTAIHPLLTTYTCCIRELIHSVVHMVESSNPIVWNILFNTLLMIESLEDVVIYVDLYRSLPEATMK